MPVDKGSDSGEARRPDDWQRIETEKAEREKAQRAYDRTHDPSEEWEKAARPLPADYGLDRPRHRDIPPEVAAAFGRTPGQLQALRDKMFEELEARRDRETAGRNDLESDGSGEANGWDRTEGEQPDRGSIHVSEATRTYILDGNGRGGGGHFPGTGLPRKTEFPASWSEGKIIGSIEDVARNPDYPPELQENGRWKVQGTRDGVAMTVIVNPDSAIYSGFPLHGPGVTHNDEHGNPKPAQTRR